MKPNVLTWLGGNDTGMSSRTIVAVLEADPVVAAMNRWNDHPYDPDDLGRCIRLLEIEPSYRARLGEMAKVSPQWAALVANWDELEALYREEFPSGRAPKCYDRMQQLLYPNGRGGGALVKGLTK